MLRISLLFCTLLLSQLIQAEANDEPIIFSVMTIPVYIEENKTGPMYELHQKMLSDLSKRLNITFETYIAPPLRAQQYYVSGKAAAMMPDFCDSELGDTTLHSVPFARVVRYILTPPNTPTINNYNELRGKKVGLVRGYAYKVEGEEGAGIELVWTTSQRQTVRMLNSGRLDAIIANLDEVTQIVKNENLAMPSVDLTSPVLDRSLCYVFRDTPLGRYLALEISAEILFLRASGALEKDLGLNHIPNFRAAPTN